MQCFDFVQWAAQQQVALSLQLFSNRLDKEADIIDMISLFITYLQFLLSFHRLDSQDWLLFWYSFEISPEGDE